jgi:hypothetical protein
MTAPVDSALLLAKYVEHVGQAEGSTFIGRLGETDIPFSTEELAVLRRLDDTPGAWRALVQPLERDREFARLLRRVAASDVAPGPVAELVAYINQR